MDNVSGTVVGDSTTSYPMISVKLLSLNYQHHQVRNPTSGAVASTIDISSLTLMESPYLLIPRAQLANRVMMNSNQDRLDNGGHGLMITTQKGLFDSL